MIAITTNNSTSVKPRRRRRFASDGIKRHIVPATDSEQSIGSSRLRTPAMCALCPVSTGASQSAISRRNYSLALRPAGASLPKNLKSVGKYLGSPRLPTTPAWLWNWFYGHDDGPAGCAPRWGGRQFFSAKRGLEMRYAKGCAIALGRHWLSCGERYLGGAHTGRTRSAGKPCETLRKLLTVMTNSFVALRAASALCTLSSSE